MQDSSNTVAEAEAGKDTAKQLAQLLRRMGREPYACLVLPDASGRIRVKVETMPGRRLVHEYAYDAAGRLVGVRRNGSDTERYAYDDQGRRSRDRCQARGMRERRHEYGPDDRLLRARDTTFEYDAMGRLERKKEPGQNDFICMYTPLGFLGAARLPDMRWVSYDRDGDGRRTAKKIDNKKVEGYGWNKKGRLLWFFDDLARETSWFEYGDEEARLPVSMKHGGQRYMLGWDQVGSLRAVIDAQGKVVKEIEYDAFGNILRETAPELRIPFGFAGGLHDRDTRLIRYRFRDYLPDTGRFTAKDPIGYKGGDSDLYGYCLDDPVNGIDPSGLQEARLLTLTPKDGWASRANSWPDGVIGFFPGLAAAATTHSALQMCSDNYTDCTIYDPSGSYRLAHEEDCGTAQMCGGEVGTLNSYLDYHNDSNVSVTRLDASPDEIESMRASAMDQPNNTGRWGCAKHVGNVLRETILPTLDYYRLPFNLQDAVQDQLGIDGEDDS